MTGPLQLTEFTQTRDAVIAEVLPLLKLHARIETGNAEDPLLARYIGMAVSSAENYLLRDVWPTVRVWEGDLMAGHYLPDGMAGYGMGFALNSATWPPAFIVRRGRARALTILDSAGVTLPAGDAYAVLTSADPKTWGFQLFARGVALNGIKVTAEMGFASFAEMPDDLQGFILAAAAAYYEVRELANYGGGSAGVDTAAFMPTYLLDSWANLTYA
jgi:hypothetical protein